MKMKVPVFHPLPAGPINTFRKDSLFLIYFIMPPPPKKMHNTINALVLCIHIKSAQ